MQIMLDKQTYSKGNPIQVSVWNVPWDGKDCVHIGIYNNSGVAIDQAWFCKDTDGPEIHWTVPANKIYQAAGKGSNMDAQAVYRGISPVNYSFQYPP